MPVAAVYINELSKARGRGRFFLLYEMLFPIGLMMTGQIGAVLVPMFGWQVMFLIGGIPGLVITWLLLRLPESPRWLISKGRFAEAEAIIREIEASTRTVRRTPRRAELASRRAGTSSVRPARAEPRGSARTVDRAPGPRLPPPHRRGLDAVVVRVLHHQRPEQLDADALQPGLRARPSAIAPRRNADERHAGDRAARLRVRRSIGPDAGCWTAASFAAGALMLGMLGLLRRPFGRRGDRAGDPELRHRRIGQCRAVSLHARDLSDADARDRHRGGDLLASSRVRGRPAAGRLHRRGGRHRGRSF